MVAHRTAAEVQLSLRKQIHQKILDLGPATLEPHAPGR